MQQSWQIYVEDLKSLRGTFKMKSKSKKFKSATLELYAIISLSAFKEFAVGAFQT